MAVNLLPSELQAELDSLKAKYGEAQILASERESELTGARASLTQQQGVVAILEIELEAKKKQIGITEAEQAALDAAEAEIEKQQAEVDKAQEVVNSLLPQVEAAQGKVDDLNSELNSIILKISELNQKIAIPPPPEPGYIEAMVETYKERFRAKSISELERLAIIGPPYYTAEARPSVHTAAKYLLWQKRDIPRWQTEIAELQKRQIQIITTELPQAQSDLSSLNSELSSAQDNLISAQSVLDDTIDKYNSLKQDISLAVNQRQYELEAAQARLEQEKRTLQTISDTVDYLLAEIDKAKKEAENFAVQMDLLVAEAKDAALSLLKEKAAETREALERAQEATGEARQMWENRIEQHVLEMQSAYEQAIELAWEREEDFLEGITLMFSERVLCPSGHQLEVKLEGKLVDIGTEKVEYEVECPVCGASTFFEWYVNWEVIAVNYIPGPPPPPPPPPPEYETKTVELTCPAGHKLKVTLQRPPGTYPSVQETYTITCPGCGAETFFEEDVSWEVVKVELVGVPPVYGVDWKKVAGWVIGLGGAGTVIGLGIRAAMKKKK